MQSPTWLRNEVPVLSITPSFTCSLIIMVCNPSSWLGHRQVGRFILAATPAGAALQTLFVGCPGRRTWTRTHGLCEWMLGPWQDRCPEAAAGPRDLQVLSAIIAGSAIAIVTVTMCGRRNGAQGVAPAGTRRNQLPPQLKVVCNQKGLRHCQLCQLHDDQVYSPRR